jgi:hypothetical protein
MECYACDQEATRHCPRCGKPYCAAHGGDPATGGQGLCAECLDPVRATPSGAVFKTSVFVLLAGSVLALWLLIRPPAVPGEGTAVIQPQATPRPVPAAATPPAPATPSPLAPAGATPTPSPPATPGAQPPAGPEPGAEPEPEPEPAGPIEYVVQEGDTWFGIAEAYGVDAESLAAVNGLTLDDVIVPGDVLVIPQ